SHLEARRRGGIWYQVDAADADPASFVYHLRLAADALGPAAKGGALPPLTPEYLQDLRGYARRFFRALYERLGDDAALVLDNFQEVDEGSAFHRLAVEAMAEVPPGVHLVVLSRVEPPPAYAPLLASGAIAVLDGSELRLAPDETAAIAQRRGIV